MADPGGQRIGTTVAGYRLDERLGAGGMGVVYKGAQVGTGKVVAVKFLHQGLAGSPDLVKRFDREITAMRRLAHPHAVGVIDFGTVDGVPYLVMDFHSGRPLSRLLQRGSLAPARAVGIARQVLAGLGAAHAVGVVHRDLKPDNILMLTGVDGDFVKILDFGLAKLAHDSGQSTQLTNTGLTLGTPGYMSPEQARGVATDERTDIYAVGVILYQMVVGRRPFVAESPLAVLRMHADDPPLPPRDASPESGVSAELEAAILRALEKPPPARWTNAEEFASALEATPEGSASSVPLVEESLDEAEGEASARTRLGRRRPAKRRRARRWVRLVELLAGGAAVAGVAFFGWTHLSRRNQHEVKQKLDGVVDGAKDALRSLTPKDPPSPPTPSSTDDDESDEPAPRDTPGARLETASRAAPARRSPRLSDAARLATAGKTDDAIQTLYQLRRQAPQSADVALLLGHAYFAKLWLTDGLREYDTALQLRPSLRGDPTLLRNAVTALDDPTFKTARALLRARLGVTALPELRRAEQGAKSTKVRARAGRLAVELARPSAKKNKK